MGEESEGYGGYEAEEGRHMIPLQALPLKEEHGYDGEHRQRDHFLYNLELEKGERAAVTLKSDPVGRDHEAVFEKGDSPREEDHHYQGP